MLLIWLVFIGHFGTSNTFFATLEIEKNNEIIEDHKLNGTLKICKTLVPPIMSGVSIRPLKCEILNALTIDSQLYGKLNQINRKRFRTPEIR